MPLAEVPPLKTRTLSDEVAERLRDAIRSGSIPRVAGLWSRKSPSSLA